MCVLVGDGGVSMYPVGMCTMQLLSVVVYTRHITATPVYPHEHNNNGQQRNPGECGGVV